MRMSESRTPPFRTRAAPVAVAVLGVAMVALVVLSALPSPSAGTHLPVSSPSAPLAAGQPHAAAASQPAVTIWRLKVSEVGLPSGTVFYASCNGTTKHSTAGATTGLITFQVPNGNYTWSIINVTGFTATPLSGSVQIQNNNVTVVVTYTSTSHAGGGLLSKYWWALAAGGVILLLIIAVVVIRWRRGKNPPAEEWTPPAAPESELPPPPPPEGATADGDASPPAPTSGPGPSP
jgi:hypothetical protein